MQLLPSFHEAMMSLAYKISCRAGKRHNVHLALEHEFTFTELSEISFIHVAGNLNVLIEATAHV